MKTLHIFHNSNLHNGVDQTTLTLVAGLGRLGVEPFAIVPQTGQVTERLDELSIGWRTMPLHCCTSLAWRAELRYLRESSERVRFLVDLLEREKFDIVHLNTGHLLDAAVAAAQAGVPALWHIHSPFEIDYQRYERLVNPEGYAWILETLGSAVIAVSNDVRASLGAHIPAGHVHTIYNGIDSEDLSRRAQEDASSVREELGLPQAARLVLGVGRISAQKDFATFVRVAERVVLHNSQAFFIIAGSPEDRRLSAELETQIEASNLNNRVFLLGKRQDVPRLMCQSDVFLSTAIFEGQGLVALEAMALESPVVAMACIGLRECIEDGRDGLLVPLGDVDAAAAAILKVLADRDLAVALARVGKDTVEQRFSSHAYAEGFMTIAQQAIKAGPSLIAPGAIGLIRGLLEQVGKTSRRIDELDRPRGLGERIGRKLDKMADKMGSHNS